MESKIKIIIAAGALVVVVAIVSVVVILSAKPAEKIETPEVDPKVQTILDEAQKNKEKTPNESIQNDSNNTYEIEGIEGSEYLSDIPRASVEYALLAIDKRWQRDFGSDLKTQGGRVVAQAEKTEGGWGFYIQNKPSGKWYSVSMTNSGASCLPLTYHVSGINDDEIAQREQADRQMIEQGSDATSSSSNEGDRLQTDVSQNIDIEDIEKLKGFLPSNAAMSLEKVFLQYMSEKGYEVMDGTATINPDAIERKSSGDAIFTILCQDMSLNRVLVDVQWDQDSQSFGFSIS